MELGSRREPGERTEDTSTEKEPSRESPGQVGTVDGMGQQEAGSPWNLASVQFPKRARLQRAGSMKVSRGALPCNGLCLARRNDTSAGVQEGEGRGRADSHDGRQEGRRSQEKTAHPGGPAFKRV